jgi:ureidoglycolate lyase
MTRVIGVQPLTPSAFEAFGDVMDVNGEPDKLINQGLCGRYHDLAKLEFSGGRVGISLFNAQARSLPFELEMMERHPEGSQSFIPMHQNPFLVVVAHDENGRPDKPMAFLTSPGQAINIHRNIWHGVLCPLYDPGLFAVVDRIGEGPNLEEYWFDQAWTVAD